MWVGYDTSPNTHDDQPTCEGIDIAKFAEVDVKKKNLHPTPARYNNFAKNLVGECIHTPQGIIKNTKQLPHTT